MGIRCCKPASMGSVSCAICAAISPFNARFYSGRHCQTGTFFPRSMLISSLTDLLICMYYKKRMAIRSLFNPFSAGTVSIWLYLIYRRLILIPALKESNICNDRRHITHVFKWSGNDELRHLMMISNYISNTLVIWFIKAYFSASRISMCDYLVNSATVNTCMLHVESE